MTRAHIFLEFQNLSSSPVVCYTGAPLLERLNVEHTGVSSYSPLPRLRHLSSLNLARCPAPVSPDALEVLTSCHALQTLNLFSMSLEGSWLTRLKGKGKELSLHLKARGSKD